MVFTIVNRQYTVTFKYNIEDVTGKVCGTERNLIHFKGKYIGSSIYVETD